MAVPTGRVRPAPDGTAAVRLYLVRDGRLEPVIRRARPGPESALAQLAAGPTPMETASGLRSALPVRPTAVRVARTERATMVLEIDADVVLLPDRDRLPAVAQLVWTATETLGVDLVRVQLRGRPLAVPTDTGPTAAPLRRGDVGSVAPR
ncbi:GerMN domain-containing protein [Pseudonocardia saturnea]